MRTCSRQPLATSTSSIGRPSQSVRKRGKRLADRRGIGPLELIEDLAQLLDAERLAIRQQRRLDDALELPGFHVLVPSGAS